MQGEGLKPFISETALSSLYESIRFYYSQHNAQKTILNNEKQTLVESFKKLTFIWGIFFTFVQLKTQTFPLALSSYVRPRNSFGKMESLVSCKTAMI